MNNRAIRLLILASALILVVGLLLWRATSANSETSVPVLLPVILVAALVGVMFLRSSKHDPRVRRHDLPETRARRQIGALVGGCVAVGALFWDHLHSAGGPRAHQSDSGSQLVVLVLILLLALVAFLVKRMRQDRDRPAR